MRNHEDTREGLGDGYDQDEALMPCRAEDLLYHMAEPVDLQEAEEPRDSQEAGVPNQLQDIGVDSCEEHIVYNEYIRHRAFRHEVEWLSSTIMFPSLSCHAIIPCILSAGG